eukprot:7213973-Alexandrium_andersonii.AAC.1
MLDYVDFHNHHARRHESEQRIRELWDEATQNKDIHKFVDEAGKVTHVAVCKGSYVCRNNTKGETREA